MQVNPLYFKEGKIMHLCAIYAFSFLHTEDIMLHTLVRLNTLRKYAYPLDRIEAATLLRYLSVTAFLTYLPHSRHIIPAITAFMRRVGALRMTRGTGSAMVLSASLFARMYATSIALDFGASDR